MNNENLPVKLYNYGQKEYIIYYDYQIRYKFMPDSKNLKYKTKQAKAILTPYMMNIERNKEITQIIKQYHHLFQRFVKIDTETIIKKDKTITINCFKLSQAFLSYLKQSKKILEKEMIEEEYDKKLTYRMDDYKEQIKNYPKIIVKDRSGKEYEKKAKIKGRDVLIEGNLYEKIFYNNQATLHKINIIKTNHYKILVEKLEKYYERITPENEDNWNKYIKTEIIKMKRLLESDNELKKMQEEYKQHNIQKLEKNNNI